MLAISINVLWVPLIVLGSAILGFAVRKTKLVKSQKRVIYLENEMLSNHAEILRLQQELAKIERSANERPSATRVVPMKDSTNTDDTQKNVK